MSWAYKKLPPLILRSWAEEKILSLFEDRPASSDGLLLNFLSIINLLCTRTVCSVDEAFMLNTITVYF